MGALPLDPLPGLCPGPAGDLAGPETPCLTRKEILVRVVLFSFFVVFCFVCLSPVPCVPNVSKLPILLI